MDLTDFYIEHFSNLCCYEDYLMRIDLMGKTHNDKGVLKSLPKCDGHKFVIAGGEIIWIDDDGERVDNPNILCISESAFEYQNDIKKVVIPEGVMIIGDYAFYGCKNLESIIIPDGVKSIGYAAFSGSGRLESVTIPSSVKSIGMDSFLNCIGLKSVIIPEGVERIGSYAFVCCDNLKSAKVPKKCKVNELAFPSKCEVIRY